MAVMVKMLLYMLEYWVHSRNVHNLLGVIGQKASSILKGRKIMARKSATSRLNMQMCVSVQRLRRQKIHRAVTLKKRPTMKTGVQATRSNRLSALSVWLLTALQLYSTQTRASDSVQRVSGCLSEKAACRGFTILKTSQRGLST